MVTEHSCIRHYNSHTHNLPCPSDAFIILYLASVLQVLRLQRPALTRLCLQGSVLLIYVANTINAREAVFHTMLF